MNRLSPSISEMIGMRFGRYLVLQREANSERNKVRYLCLCDCGVKKIVQKDSLVRGATKSCGCKKRDRALAGLPRYKHGESYTKGNTATYRTWAKMKDRCNNPKNKDWENYGGRGIKACPEWEESYESFLADMGHRPTNKHSIERIDNSKGYCSNNCKWATRIEQNRNKKSLHLVTFNGETRCITEWAELIGIPASALTLRITRYKWDVEKALTTPLEKALERTSKYPKCPTCGERTRRNGSLREMKRFHCLNKHTFYLDVQDEIVFPRGYPPVA